MRMDGKNPPANRGPIFRVGDMLNCDPEFSYDPDWDLGIVMSVDIVEDEFVYTIKWAEDGKITMEREEWLEQSTSLVSSKK